MNDETLRPMAPQRFLDPEARTWEALKVLPGVDLDGLTQLARKGSIHRVRFPAGTAIPPHTHPADEHVFVLRGELKTGGRLCREGTFWSTPAGTRQGPHIAITDVEILTVRLGAMGAFDSPDSQ